ncbi:protein CFAP20DC isoform X2 [Pseudophryne corroboree]|uniref:protein CFAP20DC isoform X2 n=1 Tax=Pseudophryne corroboree TaxID=495146 RepID=UPI0030818150
MGLGIPKTEVSGIESRAYIIVQELMTRPIFGIQTADISLLRSDMYKNEYQGGAFVEVFSAQGKDPVAKWKLSGSQSGIWKDFDKEVKSFVFVLEGSSQTIKMQLPKDNKQMLGLIQRFLIFQLYIPLGQDFSAELLITDLANIKRRLYLSTVHKELSATPLHAKIPLSIIRRKVWCNLCIDLVAFTSGIFKGAVFQSLDGITVSASCKLRKIYTMKLKPPDTVQQDIYGSSLSDCEPTDTIPRSCQITTDVDQVTQVLDLTKLRHSETREDGKIELLAETDALTTRGYGSSRDIRKGDRSHIAFGSKVLGPPPTTVRKNSARSSTESTRSSGRHVRSLQPLPPDKGTPPLAHATETKTLSPSPSHLPDQRNKENIDQTKRKDLLPQDFHPHPPQKPPTTERSRTLQSVGSARKEQRTVLDRSSVGHCRNEDKLPAQIPVPSCRGESRAKTLNNISANFTDEWIFPDRLQDLSKLSDVQYQTDNSNVREQSADNRANDITYPEGRAPEDPDTSFPRSSVPGSMLHGRRQGQSPVRNTSSPDVLEQSGRGPGMEDDFYRSDSSIEFFQWTSSPRSEHSTTLSPEFPHSVNITRSSENVSNLQSLLKASIANTPKDTKMGDFSSQRSLMPTRSLSPSGSRSEVSTGNSVISKIQQFISDNKLRTSMSKKSLKEIPKDDSKMTDEASGYDWRNYQVNRLSASEMQMLASMKRQQNEELENERTSHGLSQSQIDHCNVSMSTSSDDTTTWNSCLPPPVNQGSHYQAEMNPLAQSNPRDWLNAFSPPIIPASQNQDLDPLLKLKQSSLCSCTEGDDGIGADEEDDILTLLYDPCLNCYFDPETGKYYELA